MLRASHPAVGRLARVTAQLGVQHTGEGEGGGPMPAFAAGETGVVLVTGASSGVGECVARDWAAKGWRVAAMARRAELLEEMAADPATLGNILPLPCDVADSAAVVAAVARVEAELGAIDVLVLNAAVGHPPKPFWETSIDDVDSVIDVNLKGVMYTAHAVLQGMIQRDRGHIFGIASVAGTHGIPTQSIYCTSKHGMLGFMDTLADETRSTAVVCSTICPGGIDTPWWSDAYPYGEEGASHAAGTTTHLIQPQELSDLLFFQLSMPTNRVFKRLV